MNKFQILWGSLLVLSLTSCGDNTASTVSPTGSPATGAESMTSSPMVESTAPQPSTKTSTAPASAVVPSKTSSSPPVSPKSIPSVSTAPVATESEASSLDGGNSGMVVSKASLAALKGIVDTTKTAIEEGKLDEAKTEFAKFEDSWQTVEDGIRSKSADTYRAIEDGVKSVNSGIGSKQAKAILLASLQKLSDKLDSASN
jgi:hypothetical protein